MSNDAEKLIPSPENKSETGNEAARKQTERLGTNYEKQAERPVESGERQEAAARVEALETAISVEAGGAERKHGSEPSAPIKRGPITKKQRDDSFTTTMREVQEQLPFPSRAFSKIIHNKTVEAISDSVGTTVARPNAILIGAIFAFLATTVLYYLAKNIGYRLSGFETIGAFALGWIVGVLFDYFRVMITGKHS